MKLSRKDFEDFWMVIYVPQAKVVKIQERLLWLFSSNTTRSFIMMHIA